MRMDEDWELLLFPETELSATCCLFLLLLLPDDEALRLEGGFPLDFEC